MSAVKSTDCLVLSGKHQHPRDSTTYWLNSFKLRWSLIKQATKDPAYTERKLVLMFWDAMSLASKRDLFFTEDNTLLDCAEFADAGICELQTRLHLLPHFLTNFVTPAILKTLADRDLVTNRWRSTVPEGAAACKFATTGRSACGKSYMLQRQSKRLFGVDLTGALPVATDVFIKCMNLTCVGNGHQLRAFQ
jgi:hypothetical protein